MLQACGCGELLDDGAAVCAACGQANDHYKPPTAGPRLSIAIAMGVLMFVGLLYSWQWAVTGYVLLFVGLSLMQLRQPDKP
jgi:hypothetical protein